MTLTAPGRLFLEYADESRSRLEALRAAIHEFELHERGHVDIACVEGLLSGLMPDFVEAFVSEHPGLTLNIAAMGSHAVAEAVAEHQVDIGIVFGQSPRRDLVELAASHEPLCAIVSPGHPLARERRCRLAEVAAWRVVLPNRSFGIRQLIDRVAATARLDMAVAIETNTLAFAWRMVLRTNLVTFLPINSVRSEVLEGRLAAVPLEDSLLKGTRMTLVASASRTLSPSAQCVADSLKVRMGRRDPCDSGSFTGREAPRKDRNGSRTALGRSRTDHERSRN